MLAKEEEKAFYSQKIELTEEVQRMSEMIEN